MQQDHCPVCQSKELHPLLQRSGIPVFQNLPCIDQATARNIPRGDLTLTRCEQCSFVFNATFDGSLVEYGAGYENAQDHSPAFQAHLDKRVAAILDQGVRNSTVVEIGCGNGRFLERLALEGNNRGFGFDPSYTGPEERLDGRVTIFSKLFDETVKLETVDAVVCRHVIEHISQPRLFLANLAKALEPHPHVQLFFETPSVEWIFENRQIWDFFYEHCSYFSDATLGNVFAEAGFRNSRVEKVFGGQYLWIEATASFASAEQRLLEQLQRGLAAGHLVALWGAGAKGVTLANLLDPTGEKIDCVVDINPRKQGKFVPGTGHPIVSPEQLVKRGVKTAFILNPNYKQECQDMLEKLGANIKLLTPLSPCV